MKCDCVALLISSTNKMMLKWQLEAAVGQRSDQDALGPNVNKRVHDVALPVGRDEGCDGHPGRVLERHDGWTLVSWGDLLGKGQLQSLNVIRDEAVLLCQHEACDK